MATRGRPPKPVEQHRKQGTYQKVRHARGALVAVESAEPLPHELAPADVFAEVMGQGVGWLARTDSPTLALLRSQLEEREPLRNAAMAGSVEARKMLRDLDKQIIGLLSQLGFDPASRARLGLAEVKAKSKLEELRERAESRKG